METKAEDICLIDLDNSPVNKNTQPPPLIPPPASENGRSSLDNNPFDIIAKQINYDPFELVEAASNSGAKQNLSTDLEVRYDLVVLNDSNSRRTNNNKNDHGSSYQCGVKRTPCHENNLVLENEIGDKVPVCLENGHVISCEFGNKSNASMKKDTVSPIDSDVAVPRSTNVTSTEQTSRFSFSSKIHSTNIEDFINNSSVISPISFPYSDKFSSAVSSRLLSSSFSHFGGNITNLSKKSNTSENILNVSPVKYESIESSNDASDRLNVFLDENAIPSNENLKDYVAARIQNCIKRTLSRSFAGFGKTDSKNDEKRGGSVVSSFFTDDTKSSRTTSQSTDQASKSSNLLDKAFLNTNSIEKEFPVGKKETCPSHLKTSTPSCKNVISSSYFESPPVEILREAKRLSRYFSVSSTNHDQNEDLLSLKPDWQILDSSSDEGNSSDDSFKSLRVNFQSTNITTPKKTPDSAALKKFKNLRLGHSSSHSPSEKKTVVKVRSRSADRVSSDSPLLPVKNRVCPPNLLPAVPSAKLDIKPWSKHVVKDSKVKNGPMKALVPLKNMLKFKGSTTASPNNQNRSTKSAALKKSSSKPTASSTPKRLRKPLAENNAQEFPAPPSNQKLRRSNSYENKSPGSNSKIPTRSSSLTRMGIKPPTPIHKLSISAQSSPAKVQNQQIFSPIQRVPISTLRSRYSFNSDKENRI